MNRKLSAVGAFYTHAARDGVDVADLLTTWQVGGGRGGWKPFLHHISKSEPKPRRVIALKAPKKLPQVLSPDEVQAILDGCDRLRDRLLFAVLYDTGMRIGEALGLRHNDIAAAECEVTVRRRDNANRARAKSPTSRTVPVGAELIRLYADYLHVEYGDLDSDYVFVNLWGRPHGHPLTYGAVYDLVRRLRRRTSIDFDPHWLRHTAATRMLRDGIGLEVVEQGRIGLAQDELPAPVPQGDHRGDAALGCVFHWDRVLAGREQAPSLGPGGDLLGRRGPRRRRGDAKTGRDRRAIVRP